MNSLNIISARVSPSSSPAPTRTNSLSALGLAVSPDDDRPRDGETPLGLNNEKGRLTTEPDDLSGGNRTSDHNDYAVIDEDTPLLSHGQTKEVSPRGSRWTLLPKRIASSFINSIRFVLSTLAAPGVYLIACLYDENGTFAPLLQLKKLFGFYGGDVTKMAVDYHEHMAMAEKDRQIGMDGSAKGRGSRFGAMTSRFVGASGSSSSGLSSESESDATDRGQVSGGRGSAGDRRHQRSKSLQDSEEIAPARRSIRIKLHSDDSLRQRKHRKAQSASARSSNNAASNTSTSPKDISAQLKSPTSPVGALTKYPKTPAPPRPLIPRRQPSYINIDPASLKHQKTLILDLDETLIHSMSKGGRMSTGHMVEVRLNTTYVGVGGQASIGPQHPILYYVHKRPHCDEFLRRVSRWFNLVVFTASVQEYADPVIDWLESDRKIFSARYYRQHCTFRHGAFIKDLSSVEPDLSKVMILDNSPLSYMFHQDNAIPIQGWISDPTDGDLMYLIPFLEGLQYVSDVRALLALRGGEDGQHMA
ncbi:HAD-like domain-containing protein [Apodospora peruviana]|uniref:HAD-like domain-containing protein n=1 Tax=Apodospora peruviana TaxID=516989 RepID=A0AAE0IID0_9PEZI|nr:HAD-like domain-containing protein [Apodospora peruviana]